MRENYYKEDDFGGKSREGRIEARIKLCHIGRGCEGRRHQALQHSEGGNTGNTQKHRHREGNAGAAKHLGTARHS